MTPCCCHHCYWFHTWDWGEKEQTEEQTGEPPPNSLWQVLLFQLLWREERPAFGAPSFHTQGLLQDPAPLRTWQRTQQDTELTTTQSFFKPDSSLAYIISLLDHMLSSTFSRKTYWSRILHLNWNCKQLEYFSFFETDSPWSPGRPQIHVPSASSLQIVGISDMFHHFPLYIFNFYRNWNWHYH